jgi:uncharacterized protein (DUF2236 family)
VRADILPRGVREHLLVSVRLGIQDQGTLPRHRVIAKDASAAVQTELERHVEAREILRELDSREVVNRILRPCDEPPDPMDARFAGVGLLESTTRDEACVDYTEDERLEERKVATVERTVDEDRGPELRRDCRQGGR